MHKRLMLRPGRQVTLVHLEIRYRRMAVVVPRSCDVVVTDTGLCDL